MYCFYSLNIRLELNLIGIVIWAYQGEKLFRKDKIEKACWSWANDDGVASARIYLRRADWVRRCSFLSLNDNGSWVYVWRFLTRHTLAHLLFCIHLDPCKRPTPSSFVRTAVFNGLYEEQESQRAIAVENIFDAVRAWVQSISVRSKKELANADGMEGQFISGVTPRNDVSGPVSNPSRTLIASIGSSSPPLLSIASNSYPPSDNSDNSVQSYSEDSQSLLDRHLLRMVQLSKNCPFPDIRERFSAFLEDLKVC